MVKVPGLIRRGGGWTLRVRVPDVLRVTIGRREIWVALGTGTYRQAAELARLERVRVDALFADARRTIGQGPPAVHPSRGAILDAARTFFHSLEAKADPVMLLEPGERADRLDAAIEEAAGVASANPSDLQPVAKKIAATAGFVLQPGTSAITELAHALRAAMVEHTGRQIERLEGAAVTERDPVFAGIGPDRPPVPRGMTLQEAVMSYASTPERRHLTERTHASVAQRLALWIELLGPETPIADVTRATIREARESIIRLPAHAPKRWPNVPIREVIRIAERDGIEPQSPKNATNSIITLAALFAWGEREGHIAKSPASGLGRVEHVGHREAPRRPFTVSELKNLLTGAAYREAEWGLKQWAPLLSLFGGFRAGEIIGLRREDVAEVDGIAVIHVRPNHGRRLKTKQSNRVVPVHPALVAAGFMRWVEDRPSGGVLFADQAETLDATEKRLARAVRSVFKDDPRLVFHSFRHSFVDAMRAGGVPVEVAEKLGGWASVGSARLGYGAGFQPSQLVRELEKVGFPGLRVPACP